MDQETQKILDIFSSKMKTLEILALVYGIKKCVRQGFYEEELPKIDGFCKAHDLFLVISPFKIILADEDSIFSNKGLMLDSKDSRRGMFFTYIARDELTALQALLFETKKDHKNLGLSLGYPGCCCDFFVQHEPEVAKLDGNYEVACLENSDGDEFPFQNNIFQRDNDICVLSHFPCSLSCPASKKQADILLKLADERFPEYADELRRHMKGKFVVHGRKIRFI